MKEKIYLVEKGGAKKLRKPILFFNNVFIIVFLVVLSLCLVFFCIEERVGIFLPVVREILGMMGMVVLGVGMGDYLGRFIVIVKREDKQRILWQKISILVPIIFLGGATVLVEIGMMASLGWIPRYPKLMLAGAIIIMLPALVVLCSWPFRKDGKFLGLDL